MKTLLLIIGLIGVSLEATAQVDVTVHPNQQVLLKSDDPQVAANKKLVFDFWVRVLQAGDVSVIPQYVDENYIQHNPNVPTGRAPFTAFIKSLNRSGVPVKDYIEDLVMITAERDMVTLAFRVERKHPKDPGKTYTTTWFDMFRIEGGKIAEHWDSAPIWE